MLVTGATSGIGWEMACQLAESGVGVVALGRNAERLHALAARCPAVDTVICDLNDVQALPELVRRIAARHPDLGGLINNAGIQEQVRMDDTGYTAQHILDEVHVNLLAPLTLTHALLPHF